LVMSVKRHIMYGIREKLKMKNAIVN